MSDKVFDSIKTWVEDVIDFPYDDYSKIMNKIGLSSSVVSQRETQKFAHELLYGDYQNAENNARLKRELEALRDEFFSTEDETVTVEDTETVEIETEEDTVEDTVEATVTEDTETVEATE